MAIVEVFVIWKFLVAFLKGPSEPSMDAENLRFGQIVGAEQVVVRGVCVFVCCPQNRKPVSREFVMVSISFVVVPRT